MASLTAPERETVILMDDDSDTATITTYQRPVITRLRKNPAAQLIEEYQVGTSVGAKFQLPAALISFRSSRRVMSEDQRKAAAARLRKDSPYPQGESMSAAVA